MRKERHRTRGKKKVVASGTATNVPDAASNVQEGEKTEEKNKTLDPEPRLSNRKGGVKRKLKRVTDRK